MLIRPTLTRLLALSCLLATLSLPVDPLSARPRPPAGPSAGATVDVSRLRALGLGPTADLVGAAVAAGLRDGAGQRTAGGRVVVRLTALSLNSFAGSSSGAGGGSGGGGSGSGSDYDYLEGEVLVLGPGGEVLSQRPQVAALPSSSGGAYYQPDGEQRRVTAIGQHFAAWALRSAH